MCYVDKGLNPLKKLLEPFSFSHEKKKPENGLALSFFGKIYRKYSISHMYIPPKETWAWKTYVSIDIVPGHSVWR